MNNLHVMITPKETMLVRRISSEAYTSYCPAGEAGDLTKDDLYHYGIIGLLEAKRNYDQSRGVPWLVFAAYRVRGAMLDQLRQQPMIRIPQERQQKVKELKEAKKELAVNGVSTDALALADKLKWTVEEVHQTARMTPALISADTELRRMKEDGFQGMVLRDREDDPETAALRKEIAELVNRCLKALTSPQDRLVIVARVVEGLKLREVAETLGCSLEHVRQWQKRVENSMRECMEGHGWTIS